MANKKRWRTTNINNSRYILSNHFSGCPSVLRIWNTLQVALNLAEIANDGVAEKYLSVNLSAEDTETCYRIIPVIHRYRESNYGLYTGQRIKDSNIGIVLREAGVI